MKSSSEIRIGQHTLEISRADKVLFPDDGITKGDLIDYYQRIAGVMLPFLRDRPVSMVRCPDGIEGECFYHKDVPDYFPDWIKRVTIKKKGGTLQHAVCNDGATLVYLANQGCITPHVWLSRIDQLDCPDQLIFDLDPPANNLMPVCQAARTLRDVFKEIGMTAFVKTTGSRGLHLVAPLDRSANFDAVRAFARDVAAVAADRDQKHLTTEHRKNKRHGRVYLDTMRNAYAQTAAPAYAVRPKPGAPVSVPLDWDEFKDCRLISQRYNIRNIFNRLDHLKSDPWKGSRQQARSLRAARRRLDQLMKEEA